MARIIYGLTYIDRNTKSVFNGSDIGKEYSAKAILKKCGICQTNKIANKLQAPALSSPRAAAQPINGGIAPAMAPTRVFVVLICLSGV